MQWLAISPEPTQLPLDPFDSPSTDGPARSASNLPFGSLLKRSRDPFGSLPQEVLVETLRYLTCKETFRWRAASLHACMVSIPRREYRRFLREEMVFLPKFIQALDDPGSQKGVDAGWQHIFERCSRAWLRDDGLRNRRRIWAIVERMADELVETSAGNLRRLAGVRDDSPMAVTVARGSVGVRSGAEGCRETVMFAAAPVDTMSSESSMASSIELPDDLSPGSTDGLTSSAGISPVSLDAIHIWLDPIDGRICGLQFVFCHEPGPPPQVRHRSSRFGSRTAVRQVHTVTGETDVLTGFVLCWYGGCVRGIRFVFEDTTVEPSEYCDGQSLSQPYGTWDGPERRLVAPRAYRKLAGVTGFVDSRGRIETMAILEEKVVVSSAENFHFLTPPDTVPLTHQEASMWKRPPPNDAELLERQGPVISDWRTRAAECEVFEHTLQFAPPGRLETIAVHMSGDYVSGIVFTYLVQGRPPVTRLIGSSAGRQVGQVRLGRAEEITAVVISHGAAGVHSLQLITSSTVGPATSQRYLGTQTVYAQDPVIPRGQERLGYLTYLRAPIIGFHALYSSKLNRLVQLGLITRPETVRLETPTSNAGSLLGSPRHVVHPTISLSLPLVDTDEVKNPWVDGAPPDDMVRGRKHSDSMKAVSVNPAATFAGWIDLRRRITHVTVYGRMEGLRITYDDDGPTDSHFGNTRAGVDHQTFKIVDPSKPITCVARQFRGTKSGASAYDELPTIRVRCRRIVSIRCADSVAT